MRNSPISSSPSFSAQPAIVRNPRSTRMRLSSNRRRYADSPGYLCDQVCNRTPRGLAIRIIVNRSNDLFATNALPVVVLLRPPKQPDIGAPAATRSHQTSILHNHSPCPRSRCKEIFACQNTGVLQGALESGKSAGVLLCGGSKLNTYANESSHLTLNASSLATVDADRCARHPLRSRRDHEAEGFGDLFRLPVTADNSTSPHPKL